MPKAERSANAHWSGGLESGQGTVKMASGAAGELPVSWASRVERSDGKTSPEELIAAAHASCFSMALSHELEAAGHPPRNLDVTATCTIDKIESGWTITTMQIDVTGDVPGMNSAAFVEAANAAKNGCPVSRALKENVEFLLTAQLKAD